MCNLVLVLLVALCSTLPVLGQNISRKEEKECTLPDQSRGVCKPSSECLRSGTNSTECSIQRGIVYVCCEPTKTGSPSHVSTGRTIESPGIAELNEISKTGNGTNDDKIAERFFRFDEPIFSDWQNKDDKRRVQHNYNHFREKPFQWNPFRDIDFDNSEIVPGDIYFEDGNKEEKNFNYEWESNGQRTEWLYDLGNGSYEKHGRKKYPWENNRRTTARPSTPTLFFLKEEEDQEYPWDSYRRTTKRPYYLTERPRGTRRTTESPPKKQTFYPNGDFFSYNEKRKRISEIKCEEYSEIVTQTISGLPLIPDPSPINIKVDECKNFQSLIVGGKNTSLGEFPHMAAIGFFDSANRKVIWLCGGTLISDRYVLSAAHCTISGTHGKPVRVRLGDYNLKSDDDGAQPEEYTIADIIVHPGYKQPVKYNDIALFRLSERVNLRKDIRPACLYTEFNILHSTATAIGWGQVHRTGNPSDILQKVSLDIVDNKSCRKPYNNNKGIQIPNVLPQGIIESQLCAGDLSGKRDTCRGDSGGPLEILSDRNLCVHYIIGITSFGKPCATRDSPGVYTRVSSYIPWIESIVWPGQ